MATADGKVSDELVDLYTELAKGGAGLLITGHCYVEQRGQCSPRQIGIYADHLLPDLKRLTDAVHAHRGVIFAELSHAGSQSVMPNIEPIAISAFADGARRAADAGFDGEPRGSPRRTSLLPAARISRSGSPMAATAI